MAEAMRTSHDCHVLHNQFVVPRYHPMTVKTQLMTEKTMTTCFRTTMLDGRRPALRPIVRPAVVLPVNHLFSLIAWPWKRRPLFPVNICPLI